MHNTSTIYAALFAGANAGLPGYVQEHLHQASLVLQPKTDLGSRIKLARRLLPGLCSSMAGSKCKQVLYLPAMAVKTLKVHRQPDWICTRASFPCVKLHTRCKCMFYCASQVTHMSVVKQRCNVGASTQCVTVLAPYAYAGSLA
jgi:hypothetical protein